MFTHILFCDDIVTPYVVFSFYIFKNRTTPSIITSTSHSLLYYSFIYLSVLSPTGPQFGLAQPPTFMFAPIIHLCCGSAQYIEGHTGY